MPELKPDLMKMMRLKSESPNKGSRFLFPHADDGKPW